MQLVCCPAAERVVQPASVLLSSCPSFVRSSMSSSICLILSLLLCLLLSGSEARISPRMDSPLCSHARVSSAALNIQLDAWGGDSIRVRISPDSIVQTPDIQALLPTPPATLPPAAAQPCGSTAPGQLSHGNLEVSVSDDGSISATRRSDGLQLIASSAPSFLPFKTQGIYPQLQSLYSVTLSYSHAAGQVYGLGEHKTGSQRYSGYSHLFEHSQVYSYSEGGDISIPFYLSQAAFAVLLNEPGYGSISIDSQAAVWSFNATHQLDLWISTFPADLAEDASPFPSLSSHYAEVTGFPNPLPHFASGFWQSKNRYRNQSEVLGVAAEFHRRHVPLTVYVIDAGSWRYLGDWSFADTSNCWQDVTAMVQTLAGYGMHVMTSAWPRLDPNSSHYAEFASNGWLTKDGQGRDLVNAQDGHTFLYNAFDPAARQALWSALVSGYVQYGIQLFWLDAAEPEGSRPGEQWWSGRSDREIGMAWSLHHSRMIWEGSLAAGIPVSSIIVLSRHGWVGSPLTNTFVWSGDTHSTWEAFNTQVRLAPNVGISGIHWWATDIGGYYSGEWQSAEWNELLVRWFQWGAFLPIFRTHGYREPTQDYEICGDGGGPNELWVYQHPEIINAVINLRQSLRPYVEYHLTQASMDGVPIVRPMWYQFPADDECWSVESETQFMFGPDWLVAPVLAANASSRSVYLPWLPENQAWLHHYSQQYHDGGQRLDMAVTLADFPLFHRVVTNPPAMTE